MVQMSQQSYFEGASAAPNNQAMQQQQPTQPQPGQREKQDPSTTTHFLQNFNLVAEAAKRAQMAVLMRDMEAVGL
jgi:hypothetical protein